MSEPDRQDKDANEGKRKTGSRRRRRGRRRKTY